MRVYVVNMLIVVFIVKSTILSIFILHVTRLFGDILKIVYKETNYMIYLLREKK